jgi:hypothetical protein
VLDAGNRVVLVGNCRSGWAADVFGWDRAHTEAGNTAEYQPYPTCNPKDDTNRLVRYFEDSTWLSAAVDPTQTPADHEAGSLTPGKVAAMTACGVNLFGFDQFDPNDGRVAASIWSWAQDMPDAAAGTCVTQRADGRWTSTPCAGTRPAACRTASGWALSAAVAAPAAAAACPAVGGAFAAPRSGEENARLHAAAAGAEPWLGAPASGPAARRARRPARGRAAGQRRQAPARARARSGRAASRARAGRTPPRRQGHRRTARS